MAVHPTQLYEIGIMLCVFALLWRWRKSSHGTGWLWGVYMVCAGAERFFIEMLRAKDDRNLLGIPGLTIAQFASLIVVVIGVAVMMKWSKAGTVAPGNWLEKGGRRA